MDTTTISVIALFVGITIIGIVLRVLLNKGYDKAHNSYVRSKNAANPPMASRLSDMYDNRSGK